ncbi:patatin-like phospholipase family protein [Natronincola ferrireducens]|uniref:NTE family protein n=1 Tax=Natronincola ferrireducens TaxID=393762 RepID=A0A1G9F6D5_9FIRM|nr:patatin-like phospholipase family protein [Natronincola ferrireducens]SDK84019.1 NTE family protein [Natronincola ferrireducens]
MLGLTLEGGGSKGAYQIGAWQAFRELGIEFQGITGTSVGALNGALMIQEDFENAYDLWSNITPHMVMDIDDRIYEMLSGHQLNAANIHIILEEIGRFIKGFGFDTKPLEKLVHQTMDEERIRRCRKDFGFVTVSLTEFKPLEIFKEEVPLGKMADYLIASSYLPIFKSKKLDGKKFLDGSFYNNLPIDMLYNRGYKKIIAVRLLSRGRIKKIEKEDLEVIYIQPTQDLGNILDFTQNRSHYNMKLGYFDTLRVFKQLMGKRYYIKEGIKEEEALKLLMNLEEEAIKSLGKLYGLSPHKGTNRLLLEDIVPKWIGLMGLEEDCKYKDVIVGLVEAIGDYNKVDPFHIYTLPELLGKGFNAYGHRDEIEEDRGRSVLFKKELLLKLNKDKLLEETIKVVLKYHHNLKL